MLGYVSLCRYYARPAITIQKAQNLTIAFRFITDIEKIPLVNIGELLMFIAYSRRIESYEFVCDTQNYCNRYARITCYTLRMLCYLPGNTMYNQILHLAALTHLVWLVELDIRNLMCTPERSVHLHYAHREVATSTHLYSMLLIYCHYFLLLFCLNNPPMDLNLEVSSYLGWVVFNLPHCGVPMRKWSFNDSIYAIQKFRMRYTLWCNVHDHWLVMWCNIHDHWLVMWCNIHDHWLVMWCNIHDHWLVMWCNIHDHWLAMWCSVKFSTE